MSDVKESLPDIATIQPDRLIKYRISDDRFSGEVLLPGLWYTDFDKKIGGKWTLSSLCLTIDLVRRSILGPRGAFFQREMTSDGVHVLFIASNKFKIEKELRHIRRENVWGYYKPYRFGAWLSGVETSSFTVCQNMYDHRSGRKIYSATSVMVFANRQTRKPSKLPDWFVTRAEEFLKTTSPIINHVIEKTSVNQLLIPSECFSYEIKALQSDCDSNNHVNQAAYVKWCSDVGALAANAGKYISFKKDIGLYAIEEINVQYIGETFMDETVVVNTWEHSNEHYTAHFVIEKKEKIVFNAKLKYYNENMPQDTTSKL